MTGGECEKGLSAFLFNSTLEPFLIYTWIIIHLYLDYHTFTPGLSYIYTWIIIPFTPGLSYIYTWIIIPFTPALSYIYTWIIIHLHLDYHTFTTYIIIHYNLHGDKWLTLFVCFELCAFVYLPKETMLIQLIGEYFRGKWVTKWWTFLNDRKDVTQMVLLVSSCTRR